jgi:putative flippase GtrA
VSLQFSAFALVGLAGTLAHYALLMLLVEALAVPAVAASIAGALLGATVNYYLNHRYTFKSSASHIATAPKFFVIAGFGFVLNGAVMWVAVDKLAVHYIVGQVVASLIVLLWNFLGSRIWVFQDKGHT